MTVTIIAPDALTPAERIEYDTVIDARKDTTGAPVVYRVEGDPLMLPHPVLALCPHDVWEGTAVYLSGPRAGEQTGHDPSDIDPAGRSAWDGGSWGSDVGGDPWGPVYDMWAATPYCPCAPNE